MKAVFFSDAHLRNGNDEGSTILRSFLRSVSRSGDHLFVVGDLFDFWFSKDGVTYPGFQPIIDELKDLTAGGVQIHLFEGNHDFYLADYFTGDLGIEVFTDAAVLEMEGKRIYVAHGDMVDERDRGYRFLRRLLRSRLFYGLQRMLPLSLLWRLAKRSSEASKEYLAKPQEGLASKMETFALQEFQKGMDAVILGHCHLPVIKTRDVGDRQHHFILLGDWLAHRSYAVLEKGRFELRHYTATPL
ncbi:MAG TPA: UDP-2,3-diacylglucosamine diphosphatase [Syntrophales bacterium]|nr:UDP-2,3-diacylglucosamine diphosphatase [Syntrophales bacterium]